MPRHGGDNHRGSTLPAPAHLAGHYRNVLTGEELSASNGSLRMQDVFANFPVALLERTG